jgi:hypothetical protein
MKTPYLDKLANEVQAAEQAYGEANAAPASAGRIERINKAALALTKAETKYQHCLDGRAYGVDVER